MVFVVCRLEKCSAGAVLSATTFNRRMHHFFRRAFSALCPCSLGIPTQNSFIQLWTVHSSSRALCSILFRLFIIEAEALFHSGYGLGRPLERLVCGMCSTSCSLLEQWWSLSSHMDGHLREWVQEWGSCRSRSMHWPWLFTLHLPSAFHCRCGFAAHLRVD